MIADDDLLKLREGLMKGTPKISISSGLREFPFEVLTLWSSLEHLDLSGNGYLSSLPVEFSCLHRLRVFFCSGNSFTELPEVLGLCSSLSMIGFRNNKIRMVKGSSLPASTLKWLILTGNMIEELPAEIGNCKHLKKLLLSGNLLTDLPREMVACTELELIRIAANRLSVLPDWLLQLPKLAWLGINGNPICADLEGLVFDESLSESSTDGVGQLAIGSHSSAVKTNIAAVRWDALHINHIIGEGASGVIYHAELFADETLGQTTTNPLSTAVAVKVFKGDLTSDGLPRSEMAAYLHAGTHNCLIPLVGKVVNHPKNAQALVMQFVNDQYRTLANPPSMQTCTRDVYSLDSQFTLCAALKMATGIASLAAHLHQHGVLHGDLYAHNILADSKGNVFLGDFGAASLISHVDILLRTALQRVEVRAFGCLFEELLERVALPDSNQRQALLGLCSRCLSAEAGNRPLFVEIVQFLESF